MIRRKYRNTKVTVDGITYDSKGEYARWCQLKLEEKVGAISHLQRQVVFILAPSVILRGRKKPCLKFTADFAYMRDGANIVEDFKSSATAEETAFRMRLHLMRSVHGIEVKLTTK